MAAPQDPVLRDPTCDRQLRDEGYAVFPLLSDDEVAEIRSAYRTLVEDPDAPGIMEFDYMAEDRSAMRQVAELLAPVWARHVPGVFTDHEPVFSTFVAKHPGPISGMFLHDDRTYLDERRQRAFTMWVPLVDTSPELDNGTLWIVPGSHRLFNAFSGTGTPDWIRPYEDYLERYLVPLRMRAGEALVYDTKTVHGSTPNRTSETREAIATAVAPRGADLIHVVAAEGTRRQVYRIDREFFLEVHPHSIETEGMPDRYPLIEEFDETVLEVDPVALAAVCDPQDVPVPRRIAAGVVPRQPEPPGERARAAAAAGILDGQDAGSHEPLVAAGGPGAAPPDGGSPLEVDSARSPRPRRWWQRRGQHAAGG